MSKFQFLPFVLIWAVSCGPPPAEPPPLESDSVTRVVFLGTGTPAADPARSGPAVAIVVHDTPYLVDLGPGVVRRAVEAYQTHTFALHPIHIRHVFVTHLHSDHTAGYADLILTPWVLGRSEPLQVFGPPGLADMTEHLLAAYAQDIDLRVHGLEEADPEGARVEVHEVGPGVIYEDENVTVEAVAVEHGSWEHAHGYVFKTPDRTVVISGDTAPSEALARAAEGCDVLVHEVYSQAGFDAGPPGFQAYHSTFHTSSTQLAEIASRVRPGLLVLYHQLFMGSTEEELLEEVREGYSGPVVSARDLDVY